MNKSPLFGILAGLAAASIWGGMYVVSKAVMTVIPPYLLLTSRLLLGILTLYLVITFSGGLKVTRQQFWQLFGVGFVGYGISVGTAVRWHKFVYGLQRFTGDIGHTRIRARFRRPAAGRKNHLATPDRVAGCFTGSDRCD